MENMLTINEWLLIGAAAMLLAGIISLYYLKNSHHSIKDRFHENIKPDRDDPDTVSSEERKPEKTEDAPSLIITVKRNPAAAPNSPNKSAAESGPRKPGYWSCRYCQTLNPEGSGVCAACGHRKR